jgi:hypothetical protein
MSHPDNTPHHLRPVAPSAISADRRWSPPQLRSGQPRLVHLRPVPLALSQRQELGGMLTAGVHPWPQPLPAAWIGQRDRREP